MLDDALPNMKIDYYKVMYSANTFYPRIELKGGDKWIVGLRFMPNGSVLPANFVHPDGSVILYYHLDDFHNVIDLLRNEKPMWLFYSGPGADDESGILTTG